MSHKFSISMLLVCLMLGLTFAPALAQGEVKYVESVNSNGCGLVYAATELKYESFDWKTTEEACGQQTVGQLAADPKGNQSYAQIGVFADGRLKVAVIRADQWKLVVNSAAPQPQSQSGVTIAAPNGSCTDLNGAGEVPNSGRIFENRGAGPDYVNWTCVAGQVVIAQIEDIFGHSYGQLDDGGWVSLNPESSNQSWHLVTAGQAPVPAPAAPAATPVVLIPAQSTLFSCEDGTGIGDASSYLAYFNGDETAALKQYRVEHCAVAVPPVATETWTCYWKEIPGKHALNEVNSASAETQKIFKASGKTKQDWLAEAAIAGCFANKAQVGTPAGNGGQGTADASFVLPGCYQDGSLFQYVGATAAEVKTAAQATTWQAKMAAKGCTQQGEIKLPNINIGLIAGGGGGGILILFILLAGWASKTHFGVAKHPDENPLTGIIWAACVIGVIVLVGAAVSGFVAAGKLVPVPVLVVGSIIIFIVVMAGSLTITTGKGTSQYKWADSRVAIATAKAYFWIEVVFVAAVLIITALV